MSSKPADEPAELVANEWRIETRPVTIVATGVGLTADDAFDLWKRVLSELPARERGLEAGGMGFSAELNDPEVLR